jgi:hypothetical protein
MSNLKAKLEEIKELQRLRFWELDARRNAILAVSAPLRAARDAQAEDLTPRQRKEMDAQIKAAEVGLYEIEVERGELTRALRDPDGKTRLGPRPN